MILLKLQYREIWPFLIVEIYHFYISLINLFNKMKYWNFDISMSMLLNLERPQTFGKFDDLMSCGSKVIFKNVPCLMPNPHCDDTDLVHHGMTKNRKT